MEPLDGFQKDISRAEPIRQEVKETLERSIEKAEISNPAYALILREGLQTIIKTKLDAEWWIKKGIIKMPSYWEEECESAVSPNRKRQIRGTFATVNQKIDAQFTVTDWQWLQAQKNPPEVVGLAIASYRKHSGK